MFSTFNSTEAARFPIAQAEAYVAMFNAVAPEGEVWATYEVAPCGEQGLYANIAAFDANGELIWVYGEAR